MKKKPNHPLWMSVLFSLIVFFILIITMFLAGGVIFLLVHTGILNENPRTVLGPIIWVLVFAAASICIGTMVAAVISHLVLKPFSRLMSGLNSLSEGHYETRLFLGNDPIGKELSGNFNALASELQNTEMLRSDFINNFSHEFKTPIVSIRGFAKLLKKAELLEEQRMEYLDIIEEESERLTVMATNVLNLTKVENQSILTEQTRFNLSEQIRNCVLLLEKKWSRKELTMQLAFNEYIIYANEGLLKEVWINLLDNAIKFSPEGKEIAVMIREKDSHYCIFVRNVGPSIRKEDQTRIMNKFYQADQSHASEGNGIGLAIVKKVVELHQGKIIVSSNENETIFQVDLPKE